MNPLTADRRRQDWNADVDGASDEPLPPRRRRQFFNRRSAALGALLTCAIGFYAGVRVEKGQLSNSGTGAAVTGSGTGPAGRTGRGGLAALLAGAGRAGTGGGTAGGGGPAAPAGGAGGNASFGTVSSVNGKTLFLTEASGNTVRVTLSSATKISKTQPARRSAIRPGDTIVVQGASGSGGAVSAASITDSGTRSSGTTGSTSASGAGSSGSSGSAVGSLFSPGG